MRLQAAWYRTYDALAVPRPSPYDGTAPAPVVLSVRLRWHPYWSRAAVAVPAARAELRRQGRALERAR